MKRVEDVPQFVLVDAGPGIGYPDMNLTSASLGAHGYRPSPLSKFYRVLNQAHDDLEQLTVVEIHDRHVAPRLEGHPDALLLCQPLHL